MPTVAAAVSPTSEAPVLPAAEPIDPREICAAIKIQRFMRRRRLFVKNDTDPITMDKLCGPCFRHIVSCDTIFKLQIDGLAKSGLDHGKFQNPLTRTPFTLCEVRRIEKLFGLWQMHQRWKPYKAALRSGLCTFEGLLRQLEAAQGHSSRTKPGLFARKLEEDRKAALEANEALERKALIDGSGDRIALAFPLGFDADEFDELSSFMLPDLPPLPILGTMSYRASRPHQPVRADMSQFMNDLMIAMTTDLFAGRHNTHNTRNANNANTRRVEMRRRSDRS